MKIFLVGIGGIAMGNLARMLQEIGHEVSGSDQDLYPPMSTMLEKWGILTVKGFHKENVHGKDLIIIGNAISRGNPEVEEVLNQGIPYMSMPQAIREFFLKDKKTIVIAGTHGKTTTSFLVHHILKELGLSPGLFVGGIRKDGFPGFEVGGGKYFVIEGDEYDSAFFDKGSKFLHYKPYYLILTALDYDHADIFPDIEAIKTQFRRLLRLVPEKGKVFYWQGSKELQSLVKEFHYLKFEPYEIGKKGSILEYKKSVLKWKKDGTVLKPKLIGIHNYRNAEAALRLALSISPELENKIQEAFLSFPGVKRRQEILYEDSKTIVIEDFAHHPVAIQETIRAIQEAYPGFKIISLFEPRSATSHRNVFQKEFSKCFLGSALVFVTEVYNIKKVPKKEKLDVKKLCQKTLKESRALGIYCKNPKDLISKLKKMLIALKDENIVLLAMSNGSFGGIYGELVNLAKSRL